MELSLFFAAPCEERDFLTELSDIGLDAVILAVGTRLPQWRSALVVVDGQATMVRRRYSDYLL